MADVKRVVWVREAAATGKPLKAALTPRGADGGLQCRVVRYVPEDGRLAELELFVEWCRAWAEQTAEAGSLRVRLRNLSGGDQ